MHFTVQILKEQNFHNGKFNIFKKDAVGPPHKIQDKPLHLLSKIKVSPNVISNTDIREINYGEWGKKIHNGD